MKIVFMGTPEYAATIMRAVYDAGHEITAVYTQPDKPKGRSKELVAPPVKDLAISLNIPVFQPERIKAPEEVERLSHIDADIFVVAAFGQFLSSEILNMPKFGCVNAHGSLLPKYRGASPIQRAIANGESQTGVTIMQMDVGMDSGDILSKVIVPITEDDDEESMYNKLADAGAKLMVETLRDIEARAVTPIPQNPDEVTFAKMLTKQDGLVNFEKSAHLIDCMIRGYSTWPGAYTYINGKMLKLTKASVLKNDDPQFDEISDAGKDFESGAMLVTKKRLFVKTGDGILELISVRPEGKPCMGACDFARGARIETGNMLG